MPAVGRMALLSHAELVSLAPRQAELPMGIALWPVTSDCYPILAATLVLVGHSTLVKSAFAEVALHATGVATGPVATVIQPLNIAAPVLVVAARREAPVAWDALTLGSSSFAENVYSSMLVGANHQF